MGHLKPTPDNQRPTLEKLQQKEDWYRLHQDQTYVITGFWLTDSNIGIPEFKVTVTGHLSDVEEVVETLQANGNLYEIKVEKKELVCPLT